MGFDVHFFAKEEGEKLFLAVQVIEGTTVYEPIIEERDAISGATFYENTLEAYLLALDIIEAEEFDDVVLINQNRLIFDWLRKKRHDNVLRDRYYKNIKGMMSQLVQENETTFGSKVVKGDKNEAKKALKDYMKTREVEVNDLTDLFKDIGDATSTKKGRSSDKVIKFKRKAN